MKGIQKYLACSGIFLVLFFLTLHLHAQISPGDLSEPHAHLKGLSNCTKCHTLGEKVSNEKCLDCHLEIGIRISENRGYHASGEIKGKKCVECHSDHHGSSFKMIRFDTDRFDHSKAGYNLLGSHANAKCSSCHKTENVADPKLKLKTSTYLGLDQKCLSCHKDSHQGTLSTDCATCHDFKAFKPASKYDHRTARFTLRGKHSEVDCKLCHKVSVQNGSEFQQFRGLSFSNCTSCHKDVHNNKFGQSCTKCHSEASFRQVKGMSNFNHSRTSYPLEGKHRMVACATCHKGGYTRELKHNKCSDCHTDYHKKQFAVQGRSPDCVECHSIQGFERSSYTIERHNESPFQLTGAHLATPCFECHKKNDQWSFREIGTTCIDCHKSNHESSLDVKYDPEPRCLSCHNPKRWSEIAFDHTKTGYALEGAHLRQTCRSCHFKNEEEGVLPQQFKLLSSGCTECHKDAHQNQFEHTIGEGCLKCHDFYDWSAGLFNHDQTAFPLDGKHKDVACIKCHPRVLTAPQPYTQYKLKSFSCESCH